MKRILISIFCGTLIAGVAAAQDNATPGSQPPTSPTQTTNPAQPQAGQQRPEQPTPARTSPSPSTPQGAPTHIAAGSVIPVSLSKTVDAKKAKTGDEVVAKVMEDLKNNSGAVIIAKDTRVMGHVTEAQARTKEQKESQLGITFDKAVPKNGTEMQMPMSIQAIIGSQNDQANAGSGNNDSAASGGATTPGSAAASRPGMTGSPSSPSQSAATAGNVPSDSRTTGSSRPQITGDTKGVIGIPNYTLSDATANTAQGSVVTSERNNVKLESGTMMLLRVNQ